MSYFGPVIVWDVSTKIKPLADVPRLDNLKTYFSSESKNFLKALKYPYDKTG